MNYESALEYVYSRRKFAKSSGFERIEALLEKFGNPHRKLKFVHVVGTNGKGSVSTEISFITRSANLKTGLFTSPFVTEFCERIQIDGEYIDKDDFAEIIEEIKSVNDELDKVELTPTFFEVVFAAALIYFEREKCDIVVLEAGLGGRTDSTNIIPAPLVTVITSISLDHTQVLGNTVKEIAEEKCGVIKSGSVVVSYPSDNGGFDFISQSSDAYEVIERVCKEKNCKHISPDMNIITKRGENLDGIDFDFGKLSLKVKFTGDHQLANAAVAVIAAREIANCGLPITDTDIKSGLSDAFLPARMEIISRSPLIIIDGGHNVGCMTALSKMIKQHLSGKRITAVLGFMKDKNYESAIDIISPLCENIVCTLAEEGRGEEPEVLAEYAKRNCENVTCQKDVKKAFDSALSMMGENDALICAGSFYIVSDIRRLYK
ncbi:MAG: bifunctional folylpolyglutamate synthase/dihydrofolate synthase [Faecalibacterium sp.]|nr:bifunctional folylpolyglutamate synthase/dihydrofolate synthase [Ruminococcus sp.]MCM1392987.1 bifunctional folylpolyglutamate synthase/dihydrofolate synthase [Ruminococcus sp.]MCM1486519.1 bifunctional folylpolyglutamate synthase/dihydrofolate synthase [Faecalibacterium sp.]